MRQLLHNRIRDSYVHPQFVSDVIKPLQVDSIMDQEVQNLSGGELQRVALTMALGKVTPCSSALIWSLNFSKHYYSGIFKDSEPVCLSCG